MSTSSLEIQLLKLGGSLLTDKQQADTLRPEVLGRVGSEMAEALGAPESLPLVLGHGSGSFGHVAARRHGMASWEAVDRGEAQASADPAAAVGVLRAARRLHQLVMPQLVGAGLPAVSMPPAVWLSRGTDGRLKAALEPLVAALRLGLLPVVFGDVVFDANGAAAICSTEAVLEQVAAHPALRVERALWLGVTDGIWDERRRRIDRIAGHQRFELALGSAGASEGTDVTGGMRHRLEALWRMRRVVDRAWVLDGTQSGVLSEALRGVRLGGTEVISRAS